MTKPPRKKVKLHPIMSDEQAMKIAKEMTRDWKFPDPPIGTWVKSQGIYAGKYSPIDCEGNSLGKIFNIYAAPEDLPDVRTYVDTVKYVAGLKDWHGFDGTNYKNDKEIYAALKDGSYTGGWIIPSRDLLVGTEPDGKSGIRKGKIIQPDNLFDHQNKGTFKGAFKTAVAVDGSDSPVWYWSSTEVRDDLSCVYSARFSGGHEDWLPKDFFNLSCRPVRLVEIKPK